MPTRRGTFGLERTRTHAPRELFERLLAARPDRVEAAREQRERDEADAGGGARARAGVHEELLLSPVALAPQPARVSLGAQELGLARRERVAQLGHLRLAPAEHPARRLFGRESAAAAQSLPHRRGEPRKHQASYNLTRGGNGPGHPTPMT